MTTATALRVHVRKSQTVSDKLIALSILRSISPEAKDHIRMDSLERRGDASNNCTTVHLARIDAAKIKNKDKSVRRALAAIQHFGRGSAVAFAFAAHALEVNNVN